MKARLRKKIKSNPFDSQGRVRFLVPRERRYGSRTKTQFEIQHCRLQTTEWDDPMMQDSGCAGEFANDFRKQDLQDGCPLCRQQVEDNLSEPDVMQRWEMRWS